MLSYVRLDIPLALIHLADKVDAPDPLLVPIHPPKLLSNTIIFYSVRDQTALVLFTLLTGEDLPVLS